jgi:hypothetical protein
MFFSKKKRNMRTSANKMELLHLVGLYVQSKVWRRKDKRDHLTKNAWTETRTDCKVCMTVKFDCASLTYKVNDLVLEHNHILQTPETTHMLPSQRSISEVQAIEIELADSPSINPRVALEFASRHFGAQSNLGHLFLSY